MRSIAALIALMVAIGAMASRADAWTAGEFQYNGKTAQEFHCAPSGSGPFPAVIMLHGSGPRNMETDDFENFCAKLAEQGYYAEFVEYYSQTEATSPGDIDGIMRNFPTWMNEIRSGIDALKKNPSIDGKKIGLMGFSLGSYLALSYGATYPGDVGAIVEYYGGLAPALYPRVATMPPVLILHGDIDRIVPVSQARDLDRELTKAGRAHEMKIYPGAEHGFNFPAAMFWYKPSDANDAWDRSLKFFDKYLKGDPQH